MELYVKEHRKREPKRKGPLQKKKDRPVWILSCGSSGGSRHKEEI